MSRLIQVGASVALILLASATAAAQAAGPPNAAPSAPAARRHFVTVVAGLTPSLQRDGWEQGYEGAHLQAAVERTRTLGPLGVRVEAIGHRFRRNTLSGQLAPRTSVFGAGVSTVVPLGRAEWRLQPYGLVGAGTYRTEYGSAREWHLGLSGGAGLRVPVSRAHAVLEWRLHDVRDGSTAWLAPLSVGLRF